MSTDRSIQESGWQSGQPIIFRHGTVITMDRSRRVLADSDVLVIDGRIAAVGPALEAPENVFEIDAKGGILLPGMIDTHRHMWQTAMRAYGADWTLSQYFVWYYLKYGKLFRPEDIAAGNLLSALEAVDAGVTSTVDWSHGLSTIDHAEAAVDALEKSPGRYVFAYGNIHAGPWEWATAPDFKSFIERRQNSSKLLGFQLAFDVTGDPEFPERAAFEVARDLGLGVTTHAGVWGATNDDGIRLMHENGFMQSDTVYVHATTLSSDSYHRIQATGGSISLSTESEESCGQGYPPSWVARKHGIPMSLSVDTSVWFSADLFTAMRSTLGADRVREHLEAHREGDTVTHSALRAEQVVDWATLGGANALGVEDRLGSIEPGKQADVVLIRNDDSPVMTPILHPYGHVALQAQRGDVHTVLVDGEPVKYQHRLIAGDLENARQAVADTVEYLREQIGEEEWVAEMNPEIPESKVLDNPYTYTEYRSEATHQTHQI